MSQFDSYNERSSKSNFKKSLIDLANSGMSDNQIKLILLNLIEDFSKNNAQQQYISNSQFGDH